MMKKTIFINGRFLTQPVTGVQRYSLELLRSIDLILARDETMQNMHLVCLAPPEAFKHPGWKCIEVRTIGRNKGNLWEQIDLPLYAKGELLFSPANIGPFHYANQIITFHDASVFAVPQAYSLAFRTKYAFVFKQLAHRAKRILTVSEFSQKELAHHLRIPADCITVIPNGCDHFDHVVSESQILKQHDLKKNDYLLIVASQSMHKNLLNVFTALQLAKTSIKVVAAGGSFKQVFREKGMEFIPENVQKIGYVRDGELKALYENALGLIFPSSYEGFGLPILEAMYNGCPVLCSNAASMPGVVGDAALYFDPHDPRDIAQVLDEFLLNPKIYAQLSTLGHERAKKFTWSVTAQKTLEVLKEE